MIKKQLILLFITGIFLINGCAIGRWAKRYNEKQEEKMQQAIENLRKKLIKRGKEKISNFSEKLDKIHLGMTTSEVKNILRQADSVDCLSGKKYDLVWNYKYPVLDYRAKFLVMFRNNRVASYTAMLTDVHGVHYYVDHKKLVSKE